MEHRMSNVTPLTARRLDPAALDDPATSCS
jgi:hypothetical protein